MQVAVCTQVCPYTALHSGVVSCQERDAGLVQEHHEGLLDLHEEMHSLQKKGSDYTVWNMTGILINLYGMTQQLLHLKS